MTREGHTSFCAPFFLVDNLRLSPIDYSINCGKLLGRYKRRLNLYLLAWLACRSSKRCFSLFARTIIVMARNIDGINQNKCSLGTVKLFSCDEGERIFERMANDGENVTRLFSLGVISGTFCPSFSFRFLF